jgi:hypothetical protein
MEDASGLLPSVFIPTPIAGDWEKVNIEQHKYAVINKVCFMVK